MICIYPRNIQSVVTALTILCASASHPSLPPAIPENVDLPAVRTILLFLGCPRGGTAQRVAFSDCRLLLGNVDLSFLRVVSWLGSSCPRGQLSRLEAAAPLAVRLPKASPSPLLRSLGNWE